MRLLHAGYTTLHPNIPWPSLPAAMPRPHLDVRRVPPLRQGGYCPSLILSPMEGWFVRHPVEGEVQGVE